MDGVIVSIKVSGTARWSTEENARRGRKSQKNQAPEKVCWRLQMYLNKVLLLELKYISPLMGVNRKHTKCNLRYCCSDQRWEKTVLCKETWLASKKRKSEWHSPV